MSDNESSATASRAVVFNPKDPKNTFLTVNKSKITKLKPSNYLMWSRQVFALLKGHELHTFLVQSDTTPTTIVTKNGIAEPNSNYPPWRRQDRLLYSTLIGAVSISIQPLVASANTTHEVWSTLASIFGTPTRGHIHQLRFQIKSCIKGTKTINEYLRLMKTKTDELALLGKPLDVKDVIEHILTSLPEEYKPEVDAINSRDNPISFLELSEKLLNREAMILCEQPLTPSFPVTAKMLRVPQGTTGDLRLVGLSLKCSLIHKLSYPK